MRQMLKNVRGAAVLGLAATLVAPQITGFGSGALAGSKRAAAVLPNDTEPEEINHTSVLRIDDNEGFPQSRHVRVGRNKSMMIDFPRELRDVMVSDPEILDAVVQSSNRVYLIAKSKAGAVNVFFFDKNGEQLVTLEVTVERDTSSLERLLSRLIPGSRIKVEMLNETVILTGGVRNAIDSNRANDLAARFMATPPAQSDQDTRPYAKVINMLTVEAEEQVMLKVTVAEVNRTVLKQMGINLGAAINSGSFSTNILTQNALPITAASGLPTLANIGIATATGGAITPGSQVIVSGAGEQLNDAAKSVTTNGASGFIGKDVAYAMRFFERQGLVRTLAEPTLVAVSGESAKFLAGGEFPVPTVDTTGALAVTFKEFGVGLAFSPLVLSEGRISLKIESEVSELSTDGAVTLSNISIPALKKRQAKSTVELPSGGSLAIAGLLSETTKQSIDGTPGLKDLPVLGTLFRSRDFTSNETELVVIVTPYVVKPTARQNLARPDDGFLPASDLKGDLLGHINRVYGRGREAVPAGGYKGDVGFIVE